MQLDLFLISDSATLRDALRRIETNHHGLIFVTDATGAVSGVATVVTSVGDCWMGGLWTIRSRNVPTLILFGQTRPHRESCCSKNSIIAFEPSPS